MLYLRISVQHPESRLNLVPPVEIKQVVYIEPVAPPETAIWQPQVFKTWSEAALGGNKNATGVIYSRP